MAESCTRRLYWIPILHTHADLGSLGESVRQVYLRRVRPSQWDAHVKSVEDLWQAIRSTLAELDLDYQRVLLYQDGLPACGRELEIVQTLAQAGSHNHQLLLELVARGARLIGTEAPELLVQEYELARQVLASLCTNPGGRLTLQQQHLGTTLLKQRDAAIAARISDTLGPGETGLLFLGLLHSLDGLFGADLAVTHLGSLPSPTANGRTKENSQ